MYKLLIKLMILSAMGQFGLEISKIEDCSSKLCIVEIQKASWKILNIDWKPISVFPEKSNSLEKK
ncbi:MAG: hypothetical protein KDD50_09695 [Bdellovibrionales bacterium]|nr:hypothetical protein [Bdellovibrionales bacterium]